METNMMSLILLRTSPHVRTVWRNGSIYHVFPADSKRIGIGQRQRQLLGIRGLTYCYLEDSASFRIKQTRLDEGFTRF